MDNCAQITIHLRSDLRDVGVLWDLVVKQDDINEIRDIIKEKLNNTSFYLEVIEIDNVREKPDHIYTKKQIAQFAKANIANYEKNYPLVNTI